MLAPISKVTSIQVASLMKGNVNSSRPLYVCKLTSIEVGLHIEGTSTGCICVGSYMQGNVNSSFGSSILASISSRLLYLRLRLLKSVPMQHFNTLLAVFASASLCNVALSAYDVRLLFFRFGY